MVIKSGIYKHFKGGFVMVLFTAKHSDREELEVVYKGLNNGKYYARPVESFTEIVTNENGQKLARFAPATKEEFENFLQEEQNKKIFDTFCK